MDIISYLLRPGPIIFCIFIGATMVMHYRCTIRHPFRRQLTSHSNLFAPYNVLAYSLSAVPNTPYLDVDVLPELKMLRDNWQLIRDEALQLQSGDHIKASDSYNDAAFNSFFKKGWTRFYVKWYGDTLPSAQQLCPQTAALVQSIPTIKAALFASLPPGGKLLLHRDPFAGSLRYHLGLSTPNSDDCYINVDGQFYSWRDGEAVLFDETYLHEAFNNTDQQRIILFCDIERPLKTAAARGFNRLISNTVVRASQTSNVKGEPVGLVSRLFGALCYIKIGGRWLKDEIRWLYFVLKYLLFSSLIYFIFF